MIHCGCALRQNLVTGVRSTPMFGLALSAFPNREWIALEYRNIPLSGKSQCQSSIGTESRSITRSMVPVRLLLLTHGYSSTAEMWQGQIEALSKRHQARVVGHARPRPLRLSRMIPQPTARRRRSPTWPRCSTRSARKRHRRRTFARRLHVAGILSRASGAGAGAADHRYRPGLQEGRGARGLEQARARDRRPFRARGPRGF